MSVVNNDIEVAVYGAETPDTERIYKDIADNLSGIVERLAQHPKPEAQSQLEEATGVPMEPSSTPPDSPCATCNENNLREHSIRPAAWVCDKCTRKATMFVIHRMRKGIQVITNTEASLLRESDPVRYSELREKLSVQLARWSELEYELRGRCDFQGCIYDTHGCPPKSPVRCGSCE